MRIEDSWVWAYWSRLSTISLEPGAHWNDACALMWEPLTIGDFVAMGQWGAHAWGAGTTGPGRAPLRVRVGGMPG